MTPENTAQTKNSDFILTLDIHGGEIDLLPLSESIYPPQGLFVSHVVGTRQRLEDIRRQLIMGTLSKLLKQQQ